MAEKKKNKGINGVTSIGEARYPRITGKPDEYIPAGATVAKKSFKVDLILDAKEAADLISQFETVVADAHAVAWENIQETYSKAKAAGKKPKPVEEPKTSFGFYDELDDDDEPTGRVIVKFSTNAEVTDKETGKVTIKKIPVFDSKGKPIKNPPIIGGGSKLRVDYSVVGVYVSGTNTVHGKAYLNAVQVVELVEFAGGGAAGSRFGSVAGGYAADEDEDENTNSFTSNDADEDEDENGDF